MNWAHLSEVWLDWVVRSSLQATVMAALLLLVRFVVGRRVPPAILCAGWLLVTLRLSMPIDFRSPLSAYGYFDRSIAVPQGLLGHDADRPGLTESGPGTEKAAPTVLHSPESAALSSNSVPIREEVGTSHWSRPVKLLLAWAVGALAVAAIVFLSSWRVLRRLTKGRKVATPAFAILVSECASRIGVSPRIDVIEVPGFAVPAIVGVWHPRLVLPPDFLAAHDERQQRHVLLHELSHVRRLDVLVGYLATLALVVHWFNPIVWIVVRCLRQDRELACDALALRALSQDEHREYGLSLLHLIEHAPRTQSQPTAAFVVEERRALERRIAAIATYERVSAPKLALLGAMLLAAACATMSSPSEAPKQAGTLAAPTSSASATARAGPPTSLTGRWRVVRLDVAGASSGQRDFALVVSTKYPPPDGRRMSVGMNGMVYIRERSMSYSAAWITKEGRLDLWWEAGPDKGVLPTLMAWAGKGELKEAEGIFRLDDWPAQIVFQRNPDGTLTFHIPWTRTTATIERAAEPVPRNGLRFSALVLRFDDGEPPKPDPVSRPRATLLWERPGGGAISTNDQPLSFGPGREFDGAPFEIDISGPPPEAALSSLHGVRFAVAHVVVYDDINHSNRFEHRLVGTPIGNDVVRGISNVAILWRGSEPGEQQSATDPLMDTWPGYELVTIGSDGRSTIGYTPWVPGPYRGLLPPTAGALVTDPEYPMPFTIALQERAVVHELPSLLH